MGLFSGLSSWGSGPIVCFPKREVGFEGRADELIKGVAA